MMGPVTANGLRMGDGSGSYQLMDPGRLEEQELDGVRESAGSATDREDVERAATAGLTNAEDGSGTGTTGEVMSGGCDAEDEPGHGVDLSEAHQSLKVANISSHSFGSVTRCLAVNVQQPEPQASI